MRPAVFNFPEADADGIALAQQLGAAGNLILNGVLAGSLQPGATPRIQLPGIRRTVTLTSAGNLSGVNFTITGYNLRGEVVSQTIAGPNANTVSTSEHFHIITSIAANAAVGTDVTAGTGNSVISNWFMCDNFISPSSITVGVSGVVGTIAAIVQNTLEDVQAAEPEAGDIFDHPDFNPAVTAAAESNYAFPPRYVRCINNASGSFTFTVIQAG